MSKNWMYLFVAVMLCGLVSADGINPFDQSLNKKDDVAFNKLNMDGYVSAPYDISTHAELQSSNLYFTSILNASGTSKVFHYNLSYCNFLGIGTECGYGDSYFYNWLVMTADNFSYMGSPVCTLATGCGNSKTKGWTGTCPSDYKLIVKDGLIIDCKRR